jgi:tetratricopeptide (TPR) repeat protein
MNRDVRASLLTLTAMLVVCGLVAGPGWAQDVASSEIEHFYDAGLYEQAVKALSTEIASKPSDAALHDQLGRSFYQLGDFTQSINSLERAVELDPTRSDYHDWLGKAYGRKAEQAANPLAAFSLARKAHREFTEAVRLNPSNLVGQRDLIDFLLNAPGLVGGGQDRADEAIQALSAVDATEGALARAEANVVRKKPELAEEEYEKILTSSHRRIGVYLEVAEYYRDTGQGKEMEQAVAKAAELDPSDLRLNYYRGVAMALTQENPTKAQQYLRAYLAAAPDNSELPPRSSARQWLGRVYEQEHRLDSAAQQYRDALAVDPHNKALHDDLRRVEKK